MWTQSSRENQSWLKPVELKSFYEMREEDEQRNRQL